MGFECIDLETRFQGDEHLNENEVLCLVDFSAWTVDTQKRLMSGVKLLSNAYQQVSIEMASPHPYSSRVSGLFVPPFSLL